MKGRQINSTNPANKVLNYHAVQNLLVMATLTVNGPTATRAEAVPISDAVVTNVSRLQYFFIPRENSSTRINISDRFSLERLKQNKKKLDALKNLSSNWNGYGATEINPITIEMVKDLISELEYQPQVFPTGSGTIQLEYFQRDNNYMEIEIDGEKAFVYSIKNGEEFEEETSISNVANRVNSFHGSIVEFE